ncbi:MAG: hypothetical protein AC479_02810 [miscellaneous Crenarchaeota group-6 archaeon AD8-1]|nr:MAG: hypothetical protein AC479_02810 [miscellaneous Crenarchaeota group-6 archaeon AD8-1]
MSFTIEEIMPFEVPNRLAVKFWGKFKLKNTGSFYENDYLGLFYFDDEGKILEFIEYWNPIINNFQLYEVMVVNCC